MYYKQLIKGFGAVWYHGLQSDSSWQFVWSNINIQKDRVEETNIIKSIAIANGYNSGIVDKLIRKHSVKINSKSRLTGPSKEMCIRDRVYVS